MSHFEDISRILVVRGWVVESGNEREREQLVGIKRGSPVLCVDGRPAKGRVVGNTFLGPKIQGGVAGIAALVAGEQFAQFVSDEHVSWASALVKRSGFLPGLHDMSDNQLHCGRIDRGIKGELSDPVWQVRPSEVAKIVIAKGGVNVSLNGSHQERAVWINFIQDTTRVPNSGDQVFQLDAWYASWVGLNLMRFLTDAVQTVEAISGVRRAVVWE